MVLYTNILLDYEDSIEILFTLPPGTTLSYPNEVIEYVRASDVKTVPHISSAGMREISFQMQTNVSKTLERQLDYFRRSGKSLLLFIPTEHFASEIVITDVSLPEIVSTYQTFTITAYCYGVEGVSMLSNDSECFGEAATADSDGLGGYSSALYELYHDMRGFTLAADDVWMPAGNYNVYVRAVSTTGVTNDLRLAIHDPTAGELVIDDTMTCTTAAFSWYAASGTIDSANAGHGCLIYAQKATTDTNIVYVDIVAIVHSSGLITV